MVRLYLVQSYWWILVFSIIDKNTEMRNLFHSTLLGWEIKKFEGDQIFFTGSVYMSTGKKSYIIVVILVK